MSKKYLTTGHIFIISPCFLHSVLTEATRLVDGSFSLLPAFCGCLKRQTAVASKKWDGSIQLGADTDNYICLDGSLTGCQICLNYDTLRMQKHWVRKIQVVIFIATIKMIKRCREASDYI